jgi:hypothetical protein
MARNAVTRARTPGLCATLFALFAIAPAANAQLRPLEPVPWRLFEASNNFSAELGASRMLDQKASLAGTSGTLTEVGNFSLAFRTGRVILEAAGTGQRFFHDQSRFANPYPDVKPVTNNERNDAGDYRLSTVVRLTPDAFPVVGVLRFGTRLPTTDNTTGLDRDATDFFATVGAGAHRGPLAVQAETGLGIHGTREPRFEQDDLLLYALRAEMREGSWAPTLSLLGQLHGFDHNAIRGVENLGEARLGVRAGNRRWIRIEGVKGYTKFSPRAGILLTAGFVR